MGNRAQPANRWDDVRRLVLDEVKCEFYKPVLDELARLDLDDEDLREFIRSELGEVHCYQTRTTRKYFPGTTSDYYSIWVDFCGSQMFLKLLIANVGQPGERLVITSFKKDNRYDR